MVRRLQEKLRAYVRNKGAVVDDEVGSRQLKEGLSPEALMSRRRAMGFWLIFLLAKTNTSTL